jgi:hypothetical protein
MHLAGYDDRMMGHRRHLRCPHHEIVYQSQLTTKSLGVQLGKGPLLMILLVTITSNERMPSIIYLESWMLMMSFSYITKRHH